MISEDEDIRLRVWVREVGTSIYSRFRHFHLSTIVLFSFSIFFLSAFLRPTISNKAMPVPNFHHRVTLGQADVYTSCCRR
jgi:hypothetical protein